MASHVAWSYSGLSTYEKCAWLFYNERVIKSVPFTKTPQIVEGNKAHTSLERRVKNRITLPKVLRHMEPTCAAIDDIRRKGATVHAERKLAFTRDGKETGYFDDDVWLRVVADVTIETPNKVAILDWKNGKARNASEEQLEVNNMAMLMSRPKLKSSTSRFVFIDPEEAKMGAPQNIMMRDVRALNEARDKYTKKREEALEHNRAIERVIEALDPLSPDLSDLNRNKIAVLRSQLRSVPQETSFAEFDEIMEGYTNRVDGIDRSMRENDWPKYPGAYCRWCPVKKCQFNENKG